MTNDDVVSALAILAHKIVEMKDLNLEAFDQIMRRIQIIESKTQNTEQMEAKLAEQGQRLLAQAARIKELEDGTSDDS